MTFKSEQLLYLRSALARGPFFHMYGAVNYKEILHFFEIRYCRETSCSEVPYALHGRDARQDFPLSGTPCYLLLLYFHEIRANESTAINVCLSAPTSHHQISLRLCAAHSIARHVPILHGLTSPVPQSARFPKQCRRAIFPAGVCQPTAALCAEWLVASRLPH